VDAQVAVDKIGTIVSYRGRLHVVVGLTPMSETPQLVELEDRGSRRIRRVPSGDPQLFKEPKRAFERATARMTSENAARMSPFGSSATTGRTCEIAGP